MSQNTVEIITIGDEILYGQTLDTNSHWISQELDHLGLKLVHKTTVADHEEAILTAFAEAEKRAQIILITGGLGPTQDDLTKPCLAKYFDTPLVIFPQALAEIKELLKNRGRDLNPHNVKQAELPQSCQMISNQLGTAPGMWFEKNGKIFISMPGVPREMKKMMTDIILPRFKQRFETDITVHRIIRTCTIGESVLIDKIKPWVDALPEQLVLAYYPSIGQVKIRLTAVGNDKAALETILNQAVADIQPYLAKYIFGYGKEELEEVVGNLLLKKKWTVATAESCTGGAIAHKITAVPGSSAYFRGSIIPYHNDLKHQFLQVDKGVFETVGAVSEACVIAMAENARTAFGADVAIATSGIAGPGGATAEKPVGLVWLAIATPQQTHTWELRLGNERSFNIELTAVHALNKLRQTLIEID
jgi:nicotinamide-nucleotide amidase